MLRFPTLSKISTKKQHINGFKGLNRGLFIGSNEFSDMQNLSGDYYPVLSTRKKHRKFEFSLGNNKIVDIGGIGTNEKLYYTGISLGQSDPSQTWFYYGENSEGEFELSGGKKTFVNMGNYVIIFPDKIKYNIGLGTWEKLDAEWMAEGKTVDYVRCDIQGVTYDVDDDVTVSLQHTSYEPTPSESESIVTFWLDSSTNPATLRRYDKATSEWIIVTHNYVKISAEGIDDNFAEGDVVSIDGLNGDFKNGSDDGNYTIQAKGDDYIIIKGSLRLMSRTDNKGTLLIKRNIPQMDFVVEKNNRLWGCSSENHEIYASALGDPTNWYSYQGIASDSYAATIGSQGEFTGIASVDDLTVFFKEDCLHIVRGDMPSNYTIETVYGAGLQKGSEKSLRVINEVLYYKGRDGVYAFNGLLPVKISEDLGNETYYNAAAGELGNKYYISMKDGDGNWHMFVYDTKRELWFREDNACASVFSRLGYELYYLSADELYSVNGTNEGFESWIGEEETDFEWYAVTGDIGIDSADNKYISKLQFRMEAEKGTQIAIDVQYDKSGIWECKYMHNPTTLRVFTVPIIPRRCDTMKIRLRGKGNFKLYSITKTVEQGSEL